MSIILQITNLGDEEQVNFIGSINEDSEVVFSPYIKSLGKKLIFNFSQVSSVNSCGVRSWINFLREVNPGREIIFDECTPEIINQINMIPNFKGGAKIRSLYADYTCEACEFQKQQLFTMGQNMPSSPSDEIPPIVCDKCGETMEMDELEEQYFDFLSAAAS